MVYVIFTSFVKWASCGLFSAIYRLCFILGFMECCFDFVFVFFKKKHTFSFGRK